MGETRWNGVSTAKVFKIAMDVIANRFPGKKNAPDFKILHRPIQSQNFTGVISPQGKEATVTFTAFCRAGGAGHQFRLARQRSHCYCFTQDAMNFTQYLLILRGVVPLRHMAPDSIAICDSG